MARASKGEGSIVRDGDGWRARVTVDGKRKSVRASTKAEAAQKRRELLQRRDAGTLTSGSSPTFEAWSTHWLEAIAELAPMTHQGYRWYLNHYINPVIGSITLEKLKPEHLEKLYNSMRDGTHQKLKKPVSPATVRQAHSIIRRALKIATQRGHAGRNVALLVSIPAVPKAQTEALSIADAQAILAAAENSPYRARWVIALLLGLRPGEALGLTWDNIDLEAGELHVRHQLQHIAGRGLILKDAPKTDAGHRTVKMPQFLTQLLVEHRAKQLRIRAEEGDGWVGWQYNGKPIPLVFTQRNGMPISTRLDDDHWRELVSQAGLPHTRRYTARHTAATIMLDQIGDVAVVAATLGHSDPSFTYRVYVHALEEKKVTLAERLNAFAPK